MCPISYEYDLRMSRISGILAESASAEIGVARCFAADLKENLRLESEAADVNEDWYDTQYDPNDRDLELRLNALTNLVSHLSARKEVKESHPFKKLIIKPKKSLTIDQELTNEQTEICEPRSPSALKSPNALTFGRKKSVCFADAIGLDLEHVKIFKSDVNDNYIINDDFFDSEELHLSPIRCVKVFDASAYCVAESNSSVNYNERYLALHFPLHNSAEVFKITEAQNVCLESMNITRMFLSGLVKVKNIGFQKQVNLRYTLDGWQTYVEMPCSFSFSSAHDVFCFSLCLPLDLPVNLRYTFDGWQTYVEIPCSFSFSNATINHDVFCFSLCLPLDLPVGICCEICVRYAVAGQNFWDNNNGENYKLGCSTSAPKSSCPDDLDIDIWTLAQLPLFM